MPAHPKRAHMYACMYIFMCIIKMFSKKSVYAEMVLPPPSVPYLSSFIDVCRTCHCGPLLEPNRPHLNKYELKTATVESSMMTNTALIARFPPLDRCGFSAALQPKSSTSSSYVHFGLQQ